MASAQPQARLPPVLRRRDGRGCPPPPGAPPHRSVAPGPRGRTTPCRGPALRGDAPLGAHHRTALLRRARRDAPPPAGARPCAGLPPRGTLPHRSAAPGPRGRTTPCRSPALCGEPPLGAHHRTWLSSAEEKGPSSLLRTRLYRQGPATPASCPRPAGRWTRHRSPTGSRGKRHPGSGDLTAAPGADPRRKGARSARASLRPVPARSPRPLRARTVRPGGKRLPAGSPRLSHGTHPPGGHEFAPSSLQPALLPAAPQRPALLRTAVLRTAVLRTAVLRTAVPHPALPHPALPSGHGPLGGQRRTLGTPGAPRGMPGGAGDSRCTAASVLPRPFAVGDPPGGRPGPMRPMGTSARSRPVMPIQGGTA